MTLSFSFLLFSACDKKKVKMEFTSTPHIIESGDFINSGLNIHKSVSESDIVSKLDLKDADLKSLKITDAYVTLELPSTPLADSIIFELYCDAIPLLATRKGAVAIPSRLTVKNLNEQKISLGPISLSVIDLINSALDGVINNGKVIRFNLIGRIKPSGAVIIGRAYILIDFAATYWKCVEVPDFLVDVSDNKGPC